MMPRHNTQQTGNSLAQLIAESPGVNQFLRMANGCHYLVANQLEDICQSTKTNSP